VADRAQRLTGGGEAVTVSGPLAEVTAYLTGRANRLTAARGRRVPAPSLRQGLNQHKTAAAFVIETGLVRFG
jgi:hypothetical protein